MKYKTEKEMIDSLVGKRIIEWNQDYLKLDDGSVITIEMTESDFRRFYFKCYYNKFNKEKSNFH